MSESWRQISLAKGGQRFVFRYREGDEANVLEAFRGLADDSKSGFDWFDAAVLAFKMARRLERKLDQSAARTKAKAAG